MKLYWKIVIAVVLAIIVIFLGVSAYLGDTLTRVQRMPVTGDPASYGLQYENVTFPSRTDHLTIRGWFFPVAGSDSVIILLHGEKENRADHSLGLLPLAADLVNRGYNVLDIDFRGHGESDGNRISAGYFEQRDLLGAADYIKQRGYQHIGVLGFSMGAATALLGTADNPDIGAVVADSSWADLSQIINVQFAQRTKAPEIFLHPLLFMVKIMYGVDFPAIRPVAAISKIQPRPVFIIHGENDQTIPVENAYKLHDADPQSQLWILPGLGHTQAYVTYPEEYVKRITEFFDNAFNTTASNAYHDVLSKA